MKLFDVYPLNNITINRAQGSYVWDNDGVQYLDMYGGHAVISIGHTHPHWVKRIQTQLEKIAFYSNSIKIPLQQQLAESMNSAAAKTPEGRAAIDAIRGRISQVEQRIAHSDQVVERRQAQLGAGKTEPAASAAWAAGTVSQSPRVSGLST